MLSKKKPKIIQSRHMNITRFKDDFYHRWLYKNIHTIHAVTFQLKDQLEKYIPNDIRPNIEMVYLGCEIKKVDQKEVDKLRQLYNLNNEFIIGITGRIEEQKGQYIVIEALSKLRNLNIKLMIVGLPMDPKYLEELKNKVLEYEIKDKVIFTGFTKKINEHMQLFDVDILATPNETFGLVLIEAMENQVCVISTNKGGPLEIIDNNQNGLLFDRTSEDLKEKIQLLYENRSLKEYLAKEGRKKVQKYFNKDIQLNKLYKKVVE